MRYVKPLLLILFIGAVFFIAQAALSDQSSVSTSIDTIPTKLTWHNVEDLPALQAKSPRKVIVDVYTDWCGWCKVMDKKTFSDPTMIQYLNDKYYMVKFDGEHKSPIAFKGQNYDYVAQGRRGYHQLAAQLSGGRLSYPFFVVLDDKLETMDVIRGFQDTNRFTQSLEAINSSMSSNL